MATKISIGCDPELFIRDVVNNRFISGHDRIPGTKHEPHKVLGGAIQVDGTAVEFNIDPAKTAVEFVGNVRRVMGQLQLRAAGGNNNLEVTATPVVDYDPEYFKSLPHTALELGCDPDFNAYTQEANPPPDGKQMFRTGSGHVHIGWTSDQDPFSPGHYLTCCELVQQMDYYLGVPLLLVDKGGSRRRQLYGQAGAFRPKPYGVEYRVLSNSWLQSEALIEYVFTQARAALHEFEHGQYYPGSWGDTARELINNFRETDKEIAKIKGRLRNWEFPLPPAI